MLNQVTEKWWKYETDVFMEHPVVFLADRTNGRAIATLLRLSSVVVCL